ncbi:MAG: porin [Pseudomonadota bacterium]
MKRPNLLVTTLYAAIAVCYVPNVSAASGDLELYMDAETKQIFAEPGANRVRIGAFRPVEETAGVPAVAESVAAQAPSAARMAEIETKLEEQSKLLATVQQGNTRSRWAESLNMRGYLQSRYTELLSGDEGINLWSDRSVGDENSLGDADKNYLIRRARVVLQGDIGERLSIYLQSDFASTSGTTNHLLQMRDAYGDFYLDKDRVHRFRVGQSKVPFGFENMQSSSNRLALDRADALNSAVRDERDLGVFYYYTPTNVQTLFAEINSAGLKHTGNYGMFGLGLYNGQGANRGDRNDNQHVVARVSYPWKFSDGQYFEAGIQAYSGKYAPTVGAYRTTSNTSLTPIISADHEFGFDDERIGISATWYPQPFGIQAEWNWGRSPQLNFATNTITEEDLEGGYIQAMYMTTNSLGTFIPFVKWQYYDGANKAETNAPANDVNDIELGVEWQIAREVELSAVYHMMDRTNLVTGNRTGRPDYENFETDALRFQLQYNY